MPANQHHFTIAELEAKVEALRAAEARDSPALLSPENDGEERPSSGGIPYAPPPLKSDIRRAIYNAVYNAAGQGLTRKQIAERIGRPQSTWLEGHIEALVKERHLVRNGTPYRPNMNRYTYQVAR